MDTKLSPCFPSLTGCLCLWDSLDVCLWGLQGSHWMTGSVREQSLCRRVFSVDKAPKRALLMVAGLGYFHATIVRPTGHPV